MAQTTPEQQAPETVSIEEFNALKQQLATLQNLVNSQTLVTAATEEVLPVIPKEPIKYKGKIYLFSVASFKLPGTTDTTFSEEAAADEEVIANILAIKGQEILIEKV